jgi:predicted ABC-type transport system involved in lysophospholipase L1 biosynthesis ATPase subunit
MATVKQARIKNTREIELANKAAGTATTLGEVLMLTAGAAVPGTLSTTPATLLGVCNQTIAIADALTQVPYIVPSDEDTYIFTTTNNTNAAHNGQQMVLGADSTTVNNTGTTDTNGIVVQVEPYGVTGDKLIIGKFVTI